MGDWDDMTRSKAVVTALAEAGTPLDKAGIVTVMTAHGRADATAEDVTKVLGALVKQGKITAVERGVYQLATASGDGQRDDLQVMKEPATAKPGTRAAKAAAEEAATKVLEAAVSQATVNGKGRKSVGEHVCGWCAGAPRHKSPEGSHQRCPGHDCLCAELGHHPNKRVREAQAAHCAASVQQVIAADPGLVEVG